MERVSHLARERQPRAARCRLLVIVMRVRTVALLSGEQKMAADWSRATAGCAGRRRERISREPRTSETGSVDRFVVRARLSTRVQVDGSPPRARNDNNVEMPHQVVPSLSSYLALSLWLKLRWRILFTFYNNYIVYHKINNRYLGYGIR